MKTHEFAKHLEQLARLLRKLPNIELDSKSSLDLQKFLPEFSIVETKSTNIKKSLPLGIEDNLKSMTPAEIEMFLFSDRFTTADLTELANRLKLRVSTRQSKRALVNMIARYFEASKMHHLIRSSGQND